MRLIAGLAALLAPLALTAPARAQDERPKGVERVYRDYRDDGVIEACEHPKRALERTLDQLEPQADIDTPDLRPALEAGIEQHESDDCAEEPEPTATPTPTPSATATPAPTAAPTPDDPVDSGTTSPLPPAGDGGGGGSQPPPSAEDVTPLDPAITPVPPAATPVPGAPPAGEPTGPAPAPVATYSNPDDGLPASLLVLAALLAVLALLALLYAAVSRLGWADARLDGPRRAWREATFRAGGTWGDFADWIRTGR